MSEQGEIFLSVELQQSISAEEAWHYNIIPHGIESSKITFLINESSFKEEIKNELGILLGKEIQLQKVPSPIIKRALSKYYRKTDNHSKTQGIISGVQDDFLVKLIDEAKSLYSSDIHIECYEERCRVRIRIDGQLVERYIIKSDDYPALINKIKIKAKLDISEKRLPQDGRMYFRTSDTKFDIRVSILPTLHGEKVVLRILSNDATDININNLGFTEIQLQDYFDGIKKPHGILLISGPTGSGKTTTLYATLKILNSEHRNILTIEDPIEYTLPGINQVQLKETIGLGFANALKTFLRQDPDIIMLGEIRDAETAQMAIRAALTGHLVLSTIHTNSAWGTISRLVDMGIPPFLLANTLNTSIAQRLIRILCMECKIEREFDEKMFPRAFKPKVKVTSHYEAIGCESCHYTGFKGRKAIYEVIPIDFDLAECIKANSFNVQDRLVQRNIKTLSESAFDIFRKGETTIGEIYSLLFNSF